MTRGKSDHIVCTAEQVDEAAVWMTLLHASNRTEETDRGFRLWLQANPAHPAAFEKVSTAHEVTAALPRMPFPVAAHWRRVGFRAGFMRATAAVAAMAAMVAVGIFLYWKTAGIGTQVGEQRMLTLADGSQIFLNTDTRVVVRYDKDSRQVELKRGEALFEVARQTDRPFSVLAGDRRIKALGTSFVVRHDPKVTAVTLLEGKVAVSDLDSPPGLSSSASGEGHGVMMLSPGERVVIAAKGPPKVDQPSLNTVTAWRTGHVQFDQIPLKDAIAEMNRYSPVKLEFERPEAATIPITGIFRASAAESFALAVAAAYRLQVVKRSGVIRLSGLPGPMNQPAAKISSVDN